MTPNRGWIDAACADQSAPLSSQRGLGAVSVVAAARPALDGVDA